MTFNADKLALQPNSLTVALSAPVTPIVVGAVTSYTLSVTIPVNKLPSSANQGSLVINFPAETVIQTTSCQAQTTSATLTCLANTNSKTVTVTSSSELAKGTVITI